MGDEPAPLQSKNKIIGGCHMPFCEGFPLGQTVERNVQFNRRKLFAVICKPVVLCEVFGIKDALPVVIKEPATPYP